MKTAPFDHLLDLILGMVAGRWIFQHEASIASGLINATEFLNQVVVPSSVDWLKGYPAGLKLNSSLSKFLGDLFLWLLEIWDGLLQNSLPVIPWILRASIILSCLFGISTMLKCLDYFVRATFVYIESFYTLATKLYASELRCFASLWNLFLGKKWNVLHQRLDSADYTLDQLLLGAVFFTVLAFLFPTVLVYYLLFLIGHVGLLGTRAVIVVTAAAVRTFPLSILLFGDDRPSKLILSTFK